MTSQQVEVFVKNNPLPNGLKYVFETDLVIGDSKYRWVGGAQRWIGWRVSAFNNLEYAEKFVSMLWEELKDTHNLPLAVCETIKQVNSLIDPIRAQL